MQRRALGALPAHEIAVGLADLVVEERELHALAAAVGDPGDADRVRLRDPLVGEPAQQVLGVPGLEASVREADVALRAGTRGSAAGSAAGVAEAARRVVQDGVAELGVVVVVVVEGGGAVALGRARLEVGLAAAPAVEHHDRRERAVALRGQGHVRVERDAVPGRDALGGALRRAEANAVLRLAGVPERLRRRRGCGGRERGHEHDGNQRTGGRGQRTMLYEIHLSCPAEEYTRLG